MNSKKLKFGLIAVLSFFVSACFTILLFISSSATQYAVTLMTMTALVFELSKWILLREGMLGKYIFAFRVVLILLWLGVTVGSVVASCTYVLNETNTTENNAYISSTQYKQAEQSRNIQVGTHTVVAGEIEALKQQADALPKNYITMRNNIMAKVDEKVKSLANMTNSISQPIQVSAPLSTNGYTAFFDMFSTLINVPSKTISLFFFMGIGMLLEFLANVFAYLYQKECVAHKSSGTNPTGPKKAIPEIEQNNGPIKQPIKLKLAHANNVVSIASKTARVSKVSNIEQDLSKTNIKKYIEEMYKLDNAGQSFGYKKVSKNAGISATAGYKIKNHLEKLGLIECDGTSTRIVVEQDKALLAIRKGA